MTSQSRHFDLGKHFYRIFFMYIVKANSLVESEVKNLYSFGRYDQLKKAMANSKFWWRHKSRILTRGKNLHSVFFMYFLTGNWLVKWDFKNFHYFRRYGQICFFDDVTEPPFWPGQNFSQNVFHAYCQDKYTCEIRLEKSLFV